MMRIRSTTGRVLAVGVCASGLSLLLAACDGSASPAGSRASDASRGAIGIEMPPPLHGLRMVDRGALFAELDVVVDGTSRSFTATRRGASDVWSTAVTVPTGVPLELTVTWYDTVDQARLDLVTATRRLDAFTAPGTSTVTIDFDDFESDAFDADADSITNLQERLDGTSPFGDAPPPVDSLGSDVVLSDCGALPVATSVPSTEASSPLAIGPGTLHAGTVAPGVPTYYDLALDAGAYRLIVDVHDPGGVLLSGVQIERLDGAGEPVETFVDDIELDKVRFLGAIDVAVPETLRLRLASPVNAGNQPDVYTFGVFRADDPVPSPFFVDCPTVIPVATGDSVSFEFESGYDREVFLAFDVADARSYELDVSLTTIAGITGNSARIELVDGYGEHGPGDDVFGNQLTGFNTVEGMASRTVTFSPTQTGSNWIRFRQRIIGTLGRRYATQATLTFAP